MHQETPRTSPDQAAENREFLLDGFQCPDPSQDIDPVLRSIPAPELETPLRPVTFAFMDLRPFKSMLNKQMNLGFHRELPPPEPVKRKPSDNSRAIEEVREAVARSHNLRIIWNSKEDSLST